ncbi:hypothetical protein N9V13_07465, partial [Betaproteobacteria bacterium]|nr:hypothetical protein [Betaproteobacteria bacterium]
MELSPREFFQGVLLSEFYKHKPEFNSQNTWFINVYNGIGDAFFILGLLRGFRKVHKPKFLIIVVREGLLPITRLYKDYDSSIVLDNDFPANVNHTQAFQPNELIMSSKSFVNKGDWIDLVTSNCIPHVDWYKYGLKLP